LAGEREGTKPVSHRRDSRCSREFVGARARAVRGSWAARGYRPEFLTEIFQVRGEGYGYEKNKRERKRPRQRERRKHRERKAREGRPGGNAQGRRDYGRHERRTGQDRGKGGCLRGDGSRAGAF